MKKRINSKGKISIYKRLLLSYVILFIVIITIFIFSVLVIYKAMFHGNIENEFPYSVSNEFNAQSNLPVAVSLGGWIEELDQNYNVIHVYGNKNNDKYKYTEDELLDLAGSNTNSTEKYIGFLNKRVDSSGYYLVLLRRSNISVNYSMKLSYSKANIPWFHIFILLFVTLSLIASVIIAYIMYKKIKTPLEILKAAMRNTMENAEIEDNYITDLRMDSEMAEMFQEFNFMAKTLKYTKREKQELEKKRENMILELSHDIKTPIATINSYSAALAQDMVRESDKKQYYIIICQKAQRVNNLVEDMFTLLKIKSSDYKLNKTNEDICEFLRKECAQYYSDAQMHGLDMEAEIPEQKLLYEADYALFSRVLGNIISNSIKYNKTGNKIKINLKYEDNPEKRILIRISDDGVPIDKNIRYSMFDEFSRGDVARKTDGGTGLGLSIAKSIVERHNGNLSYEYKNNENIFSISFILLGDVEAR